MAVAENAPQETPVVYVEPEMACMPKVSKQAAREICAEFGFRELAIIGDMVKIEPVQEGVHRYPPVRVQVAHNPDFVKRYVNMGWNDSYTSSNT